MSLLSAVAGCSSGKSQSPVAREIDRFASAHDAAQGKADIVDYGCGSCHRIPGIAGASGNVGPPLGGFRNHVYVGGVAPNTPDNLVRWIEDPKAIDPRAAMPKLGASKQQASDIAAYLYSRKGPPWTG